MTVAKLRKPGLWPQLKNYRRKQGNTTNIHTKLILRETRDTGLHLRHHSVGLYVYLYSNFPRRLWKTHVLCSGLHNGHSRSSEVIDFCTNLKLVCNFLLDINSNLGPILLRFRDTASLLLRTATPPLFHPNFGGVPIALDCRRWVFKERRPYAN